MFHLDILESLPVVKTALFIFCIFPYYWWLNLFRFFLFKTNCCYCSFLDWEMDTSSFDIKTTVHCLYLIFQAKQKKNDIYFMNIGGY